MAEDYYQLLGIERNATPDNIKKAYRKQAMKYHPDRNPGDKTAEENFKKVSHAYEILSDPKKRATYDQYGSDAFENTGGPRGPGGFHDPMDIFQQFFRGATGGSGIFDEFFGQGGAAGTDSNQGDDLRYDLQITLEEAATGIEKPVKYRRHTHCPTCNGTGSEPGTQRKPCAACKGSGSTFRSHGFFSIRQPCPKCNGNGTLNEHHCKKCAGDGRLVEHHTVTVKIPPGVHTGNKLRSSSNGSAGPNGGPNGDLYILIHVAEHELYDRQGDDLHCTIPIKFTLAALGGTVEVPTLGGRATLKIPPGTASGTTFRLRDKGMPRLRTPTQHGDLLVRVEIDVPKKLNADQREKLQAFAHASGDDTHPVAESWAEKFRRFFG